MNEETNRTRRVSARTLAGRTGAGHSTAALGEGRSDAIICPVRTAPDAAGAITPWMQQLHARFESLRERWNEARRRPDRHEPDRRAHVLAHASGGANSVLVLYAGYDPETPNSILSALVHACRFANACGVRRIGFHDPRAIGNVRCDEEVEECIREMSTCGAAHPMLHEYRGGGNTA